MSPEELQAALQQEREAHAATMEQLRREEAVLKAVLEEQEGSFIALITRVTNLRVAKGEYMAARTQGAPARREVFATGSAAVDRLLEVVQEKLSSTAEAGGTLLDQLSDAASAAVTPFCPNSINFKNDKAARATGVAVITRSDIRSVRAWAKKHTGQCPQCAQRVAAQTPRWERYRYDAKATGLAAAALSAGAPNKNGYRCGLRIVRDRSLRQRAVNDERRMDILRATSRLYVTGSGGQPLADATTTADAINTLAIKWADRSFTLVRERVAAAAPWNTEGTANADLSAAVAMLLHAIMPAVRVTPVGPGDAAAQATSHKAAFAPPNATAFDLFLSVSTPVQVATLAPLIALLGDPAQRTYLVEHLLTPLAARLGAVVGMADLAAHYTAVALRALDHLHRMAQAHGLLGDDGAAAPAPAASSPVARRTTLTEKLYGVLLTLAVFNTVVEVEVAAPTDLGSGDAGDAANGSSSAPYSMVGAKVQALRLAKAFLRNLRTRTPFQLPPLNDPECADVACRIANAPTTFLEILNRTFSSNVRLPATSRSSALDLVITPKAKLSLALKLYSELCVEVYRPFDPARTAGAVLASQNGAGGRPRAPPCVPLVDLPPDLEAANAAASAFSEQLHARLEALEAAAAEETAVEQEGRKMVDAVAEAMGQSEPYQQWCEDLGRMNLEVKLVSQAAVEVLLPFGLSFVDPRESVEHLLYLHVEGSRTF